MHSITSLSTLTPCLQGTPADVGIKLTLPETIVVALHLFAGNVGLSAFKFSRWAQRMYFETECEMVVPGR